MMSHIYIYIYIYMYYIYGSIPFMPGSSTGWQEGSRVGGSVVKASTVPGRRQAWICWLIVVDRLPRGLVCLPKGCLGVASDF